MNCGVHWKVWCWTCSSNTLATWCQELTHWKRPWCWKRLRQDEKGTREDEMVVWHHWLNGHEFEQTLGDGEGQGSLLCCSPWGHKERDTTEQLNNRNNAEWRKEVSSKEVSVNRWGSPGTETLSNHLQVTQPKVLRGQQAGRPGVSKWRK